MQAITPWHSTRMERCDETTPRTSNTSRMITSYPGPSVGVDTLIWPLRKKRERDVTVVDVIIRSCPPPAPSDKHKLAQLTDEHNARATGLSLWVTGCVWTCRRTQTRRFPPFLASLSNTAANLDPDVDVVARSRRIKCQPTQQVMRFDIWHQGIIRPAPATEWRLLLVGRGPEAGRFATHNLFSASHGWRRHSSVQVLSTGDPGSTQTFKTSLSHWKGFRFVTESLY